jgi:plastocyanin
MNIRGWLALVIVAIALIGCSREDPSIIARAPVTEATPPAEGEAPAEEAAGEAQVLEVAATSGLAFEQTDLNATAGQPITVQFTNPAALQHNWVLAEPGQADALGSSGADKDNPAEGFIAASNTIANGATDTAEVPTLDAGEYTYLCTVPGHYPSMQGRLVVAP